VVPPLAHSLAAVLEDIHGVVTPVPEAYPVPAAVLVALDAPPELAEPAHHLGQIRVVLTKRLPGLRRHAGEISFPGGRLDASDRTLSETALREVEEEIGLPREEVTLLGALAVVHTIATNYVIQPFVGLVDLGARPGGAAEGPPEEVLACWRKSAHEVEEVLELTLEQIESGRGRAQLERRGIRFETDAFLVGEHLIWGATFRILDDLLVRIRRGG
jgi:8-oxo-dGTP pyrophosphatase MutT (NUDIX family)